MKKVLVYYDNFCGPNAKGGTEVATYRIANALKQTGEIEVFHAYRNKKKSQTVSIYEKDIKLSKLNNAFSRSLARFISDNEIDVVINMSRFFRHPSILQAIKKSGRDVKLIFMQHFAPGSETKKTTFNAGWHLLKLNPSNPLYWLRASIYPLLKLSRNMKYPQAYRFVYENSDRVVLLSQGYKKDYCKFGGLEDQKKFCVIPNIFESDLKTQSSDSVEKSKRVLILSRMDEIQKRISLALKIWQAIEKDTDLADWHLDIVGSGHNMDIVKKLVKKLRLQNVHIHGWQNSSSYLKDSSILMLTSEYEGLPLSILEAEAYGCVPIAFNSFSSLADVISPFNNGVIIDKFGDIDDYVAKLKDLMYDKSYREELSLNAMQSTSKFSSEIIAGKWQKELT